MASSRAYASTLMCGAPSGSSTISESSQSPSLTANFFASRLPRAIIVARFSTGDPPSSTATGMTPNRSQLLICSGESEGNR